MEGQAQPDNDAGNVQIDQLPPQDQLADDTTTQQVADSDAESTGERSDGQVTDEITVAETQTEAEPVTDMASQPTQEATEQNGTDSPEPDQALFQRNESESVTLLSNEDLRAGIRAIIPDFKDGDNRATIVDSFDGLPDEVKQDAKDQGCNGDDVQGVFHNGTIYVVADKITLAGILETLLFHEGTYGGVNALYADEGVNRAMNRLYAAMCGSVGFNKVVDLLGIHNKINLYLKGTMARELRNTVLMQEVLACAG